MYSKFFIICILYLSASIYARDVDYYSNPVIVTANRYATPFSQVNRRVSVIDSMQLASMPGLAIQDLLATLPGVDLRRRGPMGIQAEAGIRGGSFEETLVLVDGIAVNDPQTAHHNLNLPVSLQDVERVEVLHGQGTGLYGADALAGVINIITKKTSPGHVYTQGGEYGLAGAGMVLSGATSGLQNRLSLSASRADGFTDYTDFEQINVLNRTSGRWLGQPVDVAIGYNYKDFGANSYYSAAFPNEHETTETLLMAGSTELAFRDWRFAPRISWRQHEDDFILDNSRPNWYRNQHTTSTSMLQLPLTLSSVYGAWSISGQIKAERITSSNLGDHERTHGGVFLSWASPRWYKLQSNVNVYRYYYHAWGWKNWPSIDVSWRMNSYFKIYGAAGESFRMPSFTDLYYVSPANMGNPGLRYSHARSYETGIAGYYQNFQTSLGVFERHGDDVIDWTRNDSNGPWQVTNISELNTRGVEIDFRQYNLLEFIEFIYGGFTYLHSDKKSFSSESKYALNYLKYHAQLGAHASFPLNFHTNWQLQWKKRLGQASFVTCDATFYWQGSNVRIRMNALNLFDTDYTEIDGVPMPGRWLTGGVDWFF